MVFGVGVGESCGNGEDPGVDDGAGSVDNPSGVCRFMDGASALNIASTL